MLNDIDDFLIFITQNFKIDVQKFKQFLQDSKQFAIKEGQIKKLKVYAIKSLRNNNFYT